MRTFFLKSRCSVALQVMLIALAALLWLPVVAQAADVVELTSGARVQGTILARDAKSITMNVMVGSITLKRVYPLTSVHAITSGGTRQEITPKGTAAAPAARGSTTTAKTGVTTARGGGGGSRAQLDALIDRLGREQPDWYETTALNYPPTLDLDWPEPAPGGWNNQKNMGQFMWDVVHPNPNRWKEGTKLMHHLLARHKDDPTKLNRVMIKLGHMYHDLLEDYPRAAFWLRAAGVEKDPQKFLRETPLLAECYWRLGYRDEALKLLAKAPGSFQQLKLYADMGETDRALQIAKAGEANAPEHAYLAAGDACRMAGRFSQALMFYQKVLGVSATGKQAERLKRFHDRAKANIAAIKYYEQFDLSQVPDGTFKGTSMGYEGTLDVAVTVRGGRIEAVNVTQHREKQFYSAISDTPKKIIAKQHVKGVDATSNATITSEAIINATARAIGERKG